MLTPHQQLAALQDVQDYLDLHQPETAHAALLDLLRETPSDSRFYPVMLGTANWLQPLHQPAIAARELSRFLLGELAGVTT